MKQKKKQNNFLETAQKSKSTQIDTESMILDDNKQDIDSQRLETNNNDVIDSHQKIIVKNSTNSNSSSKRSSYLSRFKPNLSKNRFRLSVGNYYHNNQNHHNSNHFYSFNMNNLHNIVACGYGSLHGGIGFQYQNINESFFNEFESNNNNNGYTNNDTNNNSASNIKQISKESEISISNSNNEENSIAGDTFATKPGIVKRYQTTDITKGIFEERRSIQGLHFFPCFFFCTCLLFVSFGMNFLKFWSLFFFLVRTKFI